jgi:hypothetical protein
VEEVEEDKTVVVEEVLEVLELRLVARLEEELQMKINLV